ncbi:MAG: protoheme IX farnesyltransferase [Melioribacteraceae bacterium]|nr:protoheme IX farnesyltransferase [Melioribacteraceae bacterium]MCF8264009.1 protoheme IX farnesyltransferase [Melioribacteraceae bacterium]MCF8431788.1 protoheme IX farnesyltransferase [Melioribacteraceae bacterium]
MKQISKRILWILRLPKLNQPAKCNPMIADQKILSQKTVETNILYSFKNFISIASELGKMRITFFVGITTVIGYILATSSVDLKIALTTFGVFLIASGSSALNHVQEAKYDSMMDRTKSRPIPSGKISKTNAGIFAVALLFSGSILMFISSGFVPLGLAFLTLVWYNVIYTPLKQKFALAIIPGSLVGALPPVIGWAASGLSIFEDPILALALFFFVWQIPHFWLLLILHGKDYEKAGYPTLNKLFSDSQLSRISFIWIAALAVLSLFIVSFDASFTAYSITSLIALAVWLVLTSRKLLDEFSRLVVKKSFLTINLYVLLVVLVLSIDKLI